MGLKFDSVISRDFSAMRPQALIRSGNCNSPGNTTALPRFEFQKRSQLFIRTHNETLSIVAMRVQIVGSQESRTERQPQLHPALLRLSAIISQYFMLCRAWPPFHRTALVEPYRFFSAGDATSFWKRGSLRIGSHSQRYFRSLIVML
jgi:hypothetical protein